MATQQQAVSARVRVPALRSAFLVMALTLPGACAFEGSIPPAAVIACSRNDDCPAPTRCRVGQNRCVAASLATPRCGDDILDVGELCDDGNNSDGDGCRADCRKLESCGDAVIDSGEQCDDGNVNPADHCDDCLVSTWVVSLVGNPREAPNELPQVHSMNGFAVDVRGRIHVVDQTTCEILRLDPDGSAVEVAGVGACASDDRDGVATEVALSAPSLVAVGNDGAIFFVSLAGQGNTQLLKRIDPTTGIVQTMAGAPGLGGGGDGGPAALASFGSIADLKVDPQGRIYVSDPVNHRLRRIDPNNGNIISTVAGNGSSGPGGDGVATDESLDVGQIAIDAVTGDVYVVENALQRVRLLSSDGTIRTVAADLGDVRLNIAAHDGRLFLFDELSSQIRRQNPDGTFTVVAGSGRAGYSGDGGPASAADLEFGRIAIDPRASDGAFTPLVISGLLAVRRIDDDGMITIVRTNRGRGLPLTQPLPATTAVSAKVMAYDPVGADVLVSDGRLLLRIDDKGLVTPIGGLANHSEGPALLAAMAPTHMVVDALGSLYLSEGQRIRRLDVDGTLSVVEMGFQAPVQVGALAIDAMGRPVFADLISESIAVIQRIDTSFGVSTMTTLAGVIGGSSDDGVPATGALLESIDALAFDRQGRLLLTNAARSCVRRIEDDGTITTMAGVCGVAGFAGDGGPAHGALLNRPQGLAVASDGRIFIADAINEAIRVVDDNGVISTVAGSGALALGGGDGGAALLAQVSPSALAIDSLDRLLMIDLNTVRRLETDGTIVTVVGSRVSLADGAPPTLRHLAATTTALAFPAALATGYPGSRVVIADPIANTIVAVVGGLLEVVAGTGTFGAAGDGGPAIDAQLGGPLGVAVDGLGRIVIADTLNHRIRRVDVDGTISTIAGSGRLGLIDGPAASAQLNLPSSVDVDDAGAVYFADTGNHCVRVITDGVIRTVAGSGVAGFGGDGQPAVHALLHSPGGVAVDHDGRVYVADTGNARVRRIGLDGSIETVAGTGAAGFDGDGGPARNAQMVAPTGIAIDDLGGVVVADPIDSRIRRIDVDGVISTIVGSTRSGSSGDGGPALAALLTDPMAVAVDAEGRLFMADTHEGQVREIDGQGVMRTTVGAVARIGHVAFNDPLLNFGGPGKILTLDRSTSLIANGPLVALRHDVQQVEQVAGSYFQQLPTPGLARYTDATFPNVTALAFDRATSVIFVSTTSNPTRNDFTTVEQHIMAIHADDVADADRWTIEDLAGTQDTSFGNITALRFDPVRRRLYIADSGTGSVRALEVDDGVVSTVLGPESFDPQGPQALAVAPNGDLFVMDSTRVVRFQPDLEQPPSVVIGDGTVIGDGLHSRDLTVTSPSGLAIDLFGNVFVSSERAVRLLSARNGVVDVYGPSLTIFPTAASEHPIECISDIAIYDDNRLLLVDCSGIVVQLDHRND